jgi:hypothetical protein
MTRKADLPPEQHVRTVMAGMLADATAGGPRPTMLAWPATSAWPTPPGVTERDAARLGAAYIPAVLACGLGTLWATSGHAELVDRLGCRSPGC